MLFSNKAKRLLISASFVLIAFAGKSHAIKCAFGSTPVERYTVTGSEMYCLDQSGNITSSGTFANVGGYKMGSTPPTTATSPTQSIRIPFNNASGATMAAGAVVIAASSTSVRAPGTFLAVLSTTAWIGINESSLAAAATGYMAVGGYAAVLTTGTVNYGDILVSTDTVAGYAGAIAGGAGVLEGTVIGKAMTAGTATGGLTLIRIGN